MPHLWLYNDSPNGYCDTDGGKDSGRDSTGLCSNHGSMRQLELPHLLQTG